MNNKQENTDLIKEVLSLRSENAKLKEALGKANDTTIDKLLMEFQDAAQEGENFTLADIESILYDNYSQLKDNGTKKAD